MLSKLARYLGNNVLGLVALFVALGGTAYAVNTVSSADIIDGEVTSADVRNQDILSADVKDQSLTTFDVSTFLGLDVVDGTLTGDDVSDASTLGPQEIHEEFLSFNDTLLDSDLATGSVGTDEVDDNSLTGADINEATLAVPASLGPVAFRAANDVALDDSNQPTQIITVALPPGNYTAVATANFSGVSFNGGGPAQRTVTCEFRSGGSPVGGGARDTRPVPVGGFVDRELTVLGTAFVPAGPNGDITLRCSSMTQDEFVDDAALIVTKTGSGF